MYFPYDYIVAFDDDYSSDQIDKENLDKLIASMPADVDSNELETIIIHTCVTLQEILQNEPGIHHIAQIITYKTYRIKVELNNTSWHIPYTLPFKYNYPVYTNNKIIHYGPETSIIRLTQA